MAKNLIKRTISIDLGASVALDRLARHHGKTRQQVLVELISEASRLTTKDMTRDEWDRYFGRTPGTIPPATGCSV